MKKNIFSAILMAMLMLVTSVAFTSCKTEDLDTNQFTGEAKLIAFGPNPVARGGELRFVGVGLDQVKSVTFVGAADVTEINKVSAEDIRVIVPLTAQVGEVTLTLANKELVTKTPLTFTEPVAFAKENAVSPLVLKPGEKLTIKGQYLHLVEFVEFEGGATATPLAEVNQEDPFNETLEVIVPAAAKSGKFSVLFEPQVVEEDTIYNSVLSPVAIEVLVPAVEAVKEVVDAKPGDAVEVSGTNFDLITAVVMPTGDSIAYMKSEDDKSIQFALPANITNGEICVLTASGVKVVVANVTVALPKEITMTPDEDLVPGAVVTIAGKNLELVKGVQFQTLAGVVDAEIAAGATATSLKVTVPEGIATGHVILNTAANISVDGTTEAGLKYLTLKPTFKNFASNELSLGSVVTIYGKNLDLVTKVSFTGGAEVEEFLEEATATCIKVQMPTEKVETGVLTLTMANGETVETGSLTVNLPEFCYVLEWPELVDGEPIRAGSVLIVTVDHADRLLSVEANGQATQFMVNGNTLYILTPYNGKPGTKFTLISDNGSISYKYDLKPNTEIETVIWTGMHSAGAWEAGMQELAWGGYDWSTVQPGMELKVQFTVDPAKEYGCQIRFARGDGWVALPGTKEFEGADNDGNIAMADDLTEYSFVLTEEMIAEMNANGGLVICGAWFILTKVSIVEHVSLEETLWSGSAVADDWTNQPAFFEDGATDLLAAGFKVGSIMRFYITPTEDAWNLQVVEGHWLGQKWCDLSQDSYDLAANNGAVVIEITQEIYDVATTVGGWGNVFILNGDNVICTKITIE